MEKDILYAMAHGWGLKPHEDNGNMLYLVPADLNDARRGWGSKWTSCQVHTMIIMVPDYFNTTRAPLNLFV